MLDASFIARRRTFRSSKLFRAALAGTFVFLVLVTWLSQPTAASSSSTSSSSAQFLSPARRNLQLPDSYDRDRDINVNVNAMTLKTKDAHAQSVLAHAGATAASRPSSIPMRLITFNIRYANDYPVKGEKPWPVRGPRLATQLKFITSGQDSPFICLQECLHKQLTDIHEALDGDGSSSSDDNEGSRPSWAYIGRGREDGDEDGEFSPVLYRSDTWACERNETRWLSETPDRPSLGWDANNKRVATLGQFSHRRTGARVVVIATHFDHIGEDARDNSAGLLLQWADEWAADAAASASASASYSKDTPPPPPVDVFIGGDFNSEVDGRAYKRMTHKGSNMADLYDVVPKRDHYGNHLTYTSFGEGEHGTRIDFLFAREPRSARVKTFGVLPNGFDDGMIFSDHRAVVADLDLKV